MRTRLLTLALVLALMFGATTAFGVSTGLEPQPAAAHTYYTCQGTAIGGGGYISQWRDSGAGYFHYRAVTFRVYGTSYNTVYGCPWVGIGW